MNIRTLSIVIPAYNEEKTIYSILEKVSAVMLIHDIQKEIIIVNDCSKDGTEQEVKKFINNNLDSNVQYFRHEINKGKGAVQADPWAAL